MTDGQPPQKSRMPAIGCLLMLAGIALAPVLARSVREAESPSLPLALLVDGLRLGVFVGLAVLLVGLVRNRRIARQARAAPGTEAGIPRGGG